MRPALLNGRASNSILPIPPFSLFPPIPSHNPHSHVATAAVLSIQPPSAQALAEPTVPRNDAEAVAGLPLGAPHEDDLRPLRLHMQRIAGEVHAVPRPTRPHDDVVRGAALQYSPVYCPLLAQLLASNIQRLSDAVANLLKADAPPRKKLSAALCALCRPIATAVKAGAMQEQLLAEAVHADWRRNAAALARQHDHSYATAAHGEPVVSADHAEPIRLVTVVVSGLENVVRCLQSLCRTQPAPHGAQWGAPVQALLDLLVEDAQAFAGWRTVETNPSHDAFFKSRESFPVYQPLAHLLCGNSALSHVYNLLFEECARLYRQALVLEPPSTHLANGSAGLMVTEDDELLFHEGERASTTEPGVMSSIASMPSLGLLFFG